MATAVLLFGPHGAVLAVYLFFCFVSGALIGATGIGGVLLTPLLLLLDVPVGIGGLAVLSSFPLAGLVSVASNWRVLPRRRTAAILLAAVPGACVATALLPHIPAIAVSCLIAAVAIYSGGKIVYQAWRRRRRRVATPQRQQQLAVTGTTMMPADVPRSDEPEAAVKHHLQSAASYAAAAPLATGSAAAAAVASVAWRTDPLVGVVAGFLSILTATGGPFIALPLLFALHPTSLPPSTAVAMATALCIPISACAALVGALSASATLDVGLAAAISVPLALGIPVGARVGRGIEPERLRLLIAALLLGVGGSALVKIVNARRQEARGEAER